LLFPKFIKKKLYHNSLHICYHWQPRRGCRVQ